MLGAGSLGLVYAAQLAAAGNEVHVLTRGRHVDAIRRRGGLVLEGVYGPATIPLSATSDPSGLPQPDLVILACKAPDTARLLSDTSHLGAGVGAAFSVQNGVEKDTWLASWCRPELVVGAVSMVGASELAPGRVSATLAGKTFLGPLAGTDASALRTTLAAFSGSELEIEVTERVRSAEWSKLTHAVAGMAAASLSRLLWHEVLQDQDLAWLVVRMVRETASIAAANGVELDDWPGMLPVGSIAASDEAAAVALVREMGARLERLGATSVKVSMLQSIERGRHIEVDTLYGFISREAARLASPVPSVETCYRILAAIDRHLA